MSAVLLATATPNLVLVTIDTLRADRLGCYGHVPSPSPNIDDLAHNAVVFEDATASSPLTLPSHTTMLSGLPVPSHGVRVNADVVGEDVPLVVERLSAEGYHTAAFVSGSPLSADAGLARHFEVYDDDRPHRPGGARFPPERRAEDTARAAAAWIGSAPEPFFTWVHFFDPHSPYTPPDEWEGDDPYDGEVAAADAGVGVVLRALEERRGRTVVVMAADHGEALGDHGELSHGVFLYQATVRVALMVHAPGVEPARSDRVVGLVDLAPTLLALAGIPDPSLPGVDLLSAGSTPRKQPLVAVTDHAQRRFGWSPVSAVRQGPYKYIEAPRPELYELQDDPAETKNLVVEQPNRVVEMRVALASVETGGARVSTGADLDRERVAELIALGYVAAPAAPTTEIGPDPKDRVHVLPAMEQAARAIYEGRYEEARVALEPVVEKDPTNPAAWNDLGIALNELGRHDDAVGAFGHAIEATPKDASLWNNLGQAESRAGRPDAAREAYAEAAGLSPGFAAPCVNLAVLEYRAGNAGAARKWAEEALRREPGMKEARDVLDHL
ncbi:MAG: sulfatase-like hydrolase/transferase [Deltaproteobacteria bacterium]|nr:sulfatase-like hydrolase/transferase [Deltaproteobacteria bacterium]